MVSKDQAVGSGMVAGSLIVLGIIIYLLFFTPEPIAIMTLKVIVTIAVGVVAGLVAWIGYTLATTPPPKPIEEIEKELEEELKKLEEELKKEESNVQQRP
ncbi:MAG: transcriptional regulator [Crenarchaeota archaeon]|nr:transcriptional regulator [Thermoproteota archaeon]